MAKRLIHYNPDEAGRLHCDAAGCTWQEPGPQPFTTDLIGKPCPLCGENLLTAKDFRDTKRMFGVLDFLNRWFGWLGTERPGDDHRAVRVKTHDGEISVRGGDHG